MSPKVPLNDLSRWSRLHAAPVMAALETVVSGGRFLFGPAHAAFEAAFAAFCGTDHCLGVGNGTDALQLALAALEIGPGDRVATVANAGMYASTAIRATGALPVFVDVDPASMTMDPASLADLLAPGMRAVIVTHLYGRLADMEAILAVAALRGIPVIEDCAQAHGASRNGRVAGSFGAMGCFSFYPTKNLGALGDGGAVVTSDPVLASRLAALRQYGWRRKYVSDMAGGRNSRLDEMQAAVLHYRLPMLTADNDRRRAIAGSYRDAIADWGDRPWQSASGPDHVMHLCVIRSRQRDALAASLAAAGIETAIHYPLPDYRQPVLAALDAAPLPVTEQVTAEILTLPSFPEMTLAEVDKVASALRTAAAAGLLDAGDNGGAS